MLTIYQPEKVNINGNVRLQAKFEIAGVEDVLWYETNEKFGRYMTTERVDAFLVGLLWLGIRKGENIKVKGPLSAKLFYGLNYHLLPLISQMYKYKPIQVQCDQLVSSALPNEGAVGTGLSCGIDSLSTAIEHLGKDIPENYQITHFTFFNNGSSNFWGTRQRQDKLFRARVAWAKACAEELGKELIVVDSNINDVLKMSFVRTHTLRNISTLLVFQKLFHIYYYSSTFQTLYTKFNNDSASYDVISLPLLSTENVTFYSSGNNYTRVQKTQMVSNFDLSYKYLNVCLTRIHNCGRCLKCKRTLLTMDIQGSIENYKNIFNLVAFNKVKENYIKEVIASRNRDPWFREIYEEMVRKNYLKKRNGP
ncbi:hypothetical protein V7075_26785 [Neobacillus drentensis]|uniref:hypothetical protein n=1 Tax=Neobacillus drentensis TaxID=220684 RepID=UPI002FFF593A